MGCLFSYPCLKGLRGYTEAAKEHPPIEQDAGNVNASSPDDDNQSMGSPGKCRYRTCVFV